MTESTIVLLACLAVIALMAVLLHVPNHHKTSELAACEVHRMLGQILGRTRNIEQALNEHRRVLNDAHKKINAVSKGLEKRTT